MNVKTTRLLVLAAPVFVALALAAACSSSDHGPTLADSSVPPLDAQRADADADAADTRLDASEDGLDASEVAPDGAPDVVSDSGEVDTGTIHDHGDTAVDAADGDDADAAIVDECGPPLTTSTLTTCSVTVQSWNDEGHAHTDIGADIRYCTKPPNSGPHYGSWASFRSYDHPIPWGYMVHSMEHGAVVIAYQCASGSCSSVAAPLQAVIDARPLDPLCDADAGILRRIILVPDPTLDVAVAAAAWSWTYRASCVDAASLGAFIDAHYAKAAEDFCSDGVAP